MFEKDPRPDYNDALFTLEQDELIRWSTKIFGSYGAFWKALPRRYFERTDSGWLSRDRKQYFTQR